MTIQQSLAQPTSSPPYIQTEPAISNSALVSLCTGIQEELATMLRQVLCVLSNLS